MPEKDIHPEDSETHVINSVIACCIVDNASEQWRHHNTNTHADADISHDLSDFCLTDSIDKQCLSNSPNDAGSKTLENTSYDEDAY